MKTATSGTDYMSAPKDYSALYSMYYDYVVSFVRKLGVVSGNAEDIASEILLRFYERGLLEVFDPTMVFEYDGKSHPARFKSFLSRFVFNSTRGLRDRLSRLAEHELLICDQIVDDDGTRWIDLNDGVEPAHEEYVISGLEEERLIARMRDYFKTVPKRSHSDTCDLLLLLDEVVVQARAEGRLNVNALAKKFGVSPTAMHTWLWWLRANAAEALDMPMPQKRTKRKAAA